LEKITKTNYYRIWDQSLKNIRAGEAKQEPIR